MQKNEELSDLSFVYIDDVFLAAYETKAFARDEEENQWHSLNIGLV